MSVFYFVYNTGKGPSRPLAPGTGLFAHVREPGQPDQDYKWVGDEWVEDEYLGYLRITGSPALDNIPEADLPEFVDRLDA